MKLRAADGLTFPLQNIDPIQNVLFWYGGLDL